MPSARLSSHVSPTENVSSESKTLTSTSTLDVVSVQSESTVADWP